MKYTLLGISAFILLHFATNAQTSTKDVTLGVNWPVGTHLQLTVIEWAEELLEEQVVPQDTTHYSLDIRVLREQNDTLDLVYTVDDPIYKRIQAWEHTLEDKSSKRTELICKVSKKTAQIHLPNWQELAMQTKNKYDETLHLLSGNDGGMAAYFKLIFDEAKKALETEEGIINRYASDLQTLLKPYGHVYQVGIPILIESVETNPLNKKEKIHTTEEFTLVPSTAPNLHTISYHMAFDMQQVMNMMREMFQKMNSSLASSPEAAEKKQKEFDAIQMDMSNASQYTISASTSLPQSMQFTFELIGFDGKKKRNTRHFKNFQIASK